MTAVKAMEILNLKTTSFYKLVKQYEGRVLNPTYNIISFNSFMQSEQMFFPL